jgi:4-hydroxy-2-oxoheptanedioate aldolase
VRGLSPSVRACDYGTCGVQEYIDTANANTMIVSHCETKTCVENLDEVLKVDGIDVIFIGPMDLSQSYGVPGKAVGTTAASAEAAKALIAKGVQYILLSSDEGIIVKWGKETISRIRG